MRNLLPASGLFLTVLLSPHVTAQLPPALAPSGNFADVPFVLYFQGTDHEQPQEIHANSFTAPGSLDVLPTGGANFPSYRIAAITQALQTMFGISGIPAARLDGISSGNDQSPIMYSEANQRFEFIPVGSLTSQWGVFFFSVDNSVAPDPNTILGMQSGYLGTLGIGTEVVSYYIDTPVIAPNLAGGSFLEMSRAFIASVPPNTGEQPQLAAIDLAMPHIVNWANAPSPPQEMQVLDQIAFSLTSDYIDELKELNNNSPLTFPLNPGPNTVVRTLHGTSIIKMQWTINGWGSPEIVFDYTDSNGILTESDDVDAVGMGDVPSGLGNVTNLERNGTNGEFIPDYLFLSTVRVNNIEQLLVFAKEVEVSGPTGPTTESKLAPLFIGSTTNDPTVTYKSGIRPGQNVKAVCMGDPEGAGHGPVYAHATQDPQNATAPGNPTFAVSGYPGHPADLTSDPKTSRVYLMSAGKMPVDSAVFAFFGFPHLVPSPVPLNANSDVFAVYLGAWQASTPIFRSYVDLNRGIDVEMIPYLYSAAGKSRGNCIKFRTQN